MTAARFRLIPHDVSAVQWKGEVTPAVRELLGSATRELESVNPGDWFVRTDYDEAVGGGYGLEVMDNEEFSETYMLAAADDLPPPPPRLSSLSIAIPAVLMNPSGVEATTELRVNLPQAPDPTLVTQWVAQLFAQLLPYMDANAVTIVKAVCSQLDADALIVVRDAIDQFIAASATHH